MTASAARRAASEPIPPQTTTTWSFSKNLNTRPSYSLRDVGQSLINGQTSRSRAATTAILYPSAMAHISMRAEPAHGPTQCIVDRHHPPAQFSFRFSRTDKHFLAAHAHGLNSSPRLAPKNMSCDDLVHDAGGKRNQVGHSNLRRRQSCNRSQLVQNLFQCQILSPQNIPFAVASLFERRHVSACALVHVHQVQPRVHVRRKLLLQKIDDDPPGWRRLDVLLADRCCWFNDH